ncbi:pyridoxal phosphate-dependent aminotransferase [Rathayibacter rathayi]|uniref:Aminotransferase n=1 Tax=Rathayibacter rathayi TaxID=33887 RepID=A0ABD6W7F4_RATRA|nr:pyridoxal phosphate-dependent aminotransferase [Rathayibacter rathayi]AZZ48111.1 pyridoxal phosphate-dependent aminotransferase [Rathayibacter rathayi]MWV75576.1 aminotransferase class I/II-fold pyridoxal phosphate-dependent enzyme [Rathayibacter rathayi NCPPB 2980 = VKM Ac-1601]PPF13302.1 pyridoxal phosphate-dependent aminotransferase [Rathayibacter rathayi]PPF49134.1 pyridoxal phosphate-dependent aminotransferase [Rathayibacter rathayi]PPG67703.1 pyridoxal phosphate-dependent aminotransfe
MSARTASRFRQIGESHTIALMERVTTLRAEGIAVIDLGGGEPSFDSPSHVVSAAIEALREAQTHYAPSRGLPELLTAIARKLALENGVIVRPDTEIIVTPSAKHALFVSLMAVIEPGDEVIIPTPSWVSYASMVRLLHGVPVFLPLDEQTEYQLTADSLENVRTPRSRVLLVNTPNNPTGHVLTRQELETIGSFARQHDLLVIVDEIYERVVFEPFEHVSAASIVDCADRVLTVNGFSKTFAMTGWRLGYVAGPEAVMAEVVKAHQHSVGSAGTFVQVGGVAALEGPQQEIEAMHEEYARRRSDAVNRLNRIPGIRCPMPEGGFYLYPNVEEVGFSSSTDFAHWLLETARVAVVPGDAFGPESGVHLRLSFAAPSEAIVEGIKRIEVAVVERLNGLDTDLSCSRTTTEIGRS